jgi:hypothetical protein
MQIQLENLRLVSTRREPQRGIGKSNLQLTEVPLKLTAVKP